MTDEQHQHDGHSHRSLSVPDAPFDAANQSLADALRASFAVLKVIMIVLIVAFMFTGVECVEDHQQAVVLRFGKLRTGEDQVRGPGLSLAAPFPIDETLLVGVTAETLNFNSHWFQLRPGEEDKSINNISRPGQGLNPAKDGALLAGDKGLVHVKWFVVYRIVDLPAFVATVSDANDDTTKDLIQTLLENSAVRAAAEFTSAEITQTQTDAFARQVKRLLNQELQHLRTGIEVTTLQAPSTTVPVQTRAAFARVTKAENEKEAKIQQAKQEYNRILNATAGRAHRKLIAKLDELEVARAENDPDRQAAVEAEVDRILADEPGGRAGAMIAVARAEHDETIQGLRGDAEEFHDLLDRYQAAPKLVMEWLWQQTQRRVLSNPGVTKNYLPPGQKELRLVIQPDPEARRQDEIDLYMEESGAAGPPKGAEWEIVPEPITTK